MKAASKAFFFEKKKQKTFTRLGAPVPNALPRSRRFLVLLFKKELLACFFLCLAHRTAFADAATRNNIGGVQAVTGEALYQHVCQGCHMPGGVGAVGAGHFPALANNKHLSAAGYPVAMVLRGNGGMPWFNGTLDDQQVANVVNYVRTHFGNDYKDAVTPGYVASVKGPIPVVEQ